MNSHQVEEHCALDSHGEALLKEAFRRLRLSARAHHRVLKVARTIADLAGRPSILMEDMAEALSYRSLSWQGEDGY